MAKREIGAKKKILTIKNGSSANKANNFSLFKGALGPRAQLYLIPEVLASVRLLTADQLSNTNKPVRATYVCMWIHMGTFSLKINIQQKVENSARGKTAKKILSGSYTLGSNS